MVSVSDQSSTGFAAHHPGIRSSECQQYIRTIVRRPLHIPYDMSTDYSHASVYSRIEFGNVSRMSAKHPHSVPPDPELFQS